MRRGNSYDDAVMESFFSSVTSEVAVVFPGRRVSLVRCACRS